MSAPVQNYRIHVVHPVKVVDGAFGEYDLNLDPDAPSYVTPEGIEVWIERPAKGTKGHQKTRFVDVHGVQVGPIHENLVPAIVYALYYGWRDPSVPRSFQDAAIRDVRERTVKHPGGGGPAWAPETAIGTEHG